MTNAATPTQYRIWISTGSEINQLGQYAVIVDAGYDVDTDAEYWTTAVFISDSVAVELDPDDPPGFYKVRDLLDHQIEEAIDFVGVDRAELIPVNQGDPYGGWGLFESTVARKDQ